MPPNGRHLRPPGGALVGLAISLAMIGPAPGSTPGRMKACQEQAAGHAEPGDRAEPTERSLSDRQRLVGDRVQRLESSMLKLSRWLAESEPAKAERLRDALQYAGSHRISTRIQKLAELLKSGQFSEADRQQELLLADLDALLALLTSSLNEVERRRMERERLEALKRAVRALVDEQTQILYRTQHVEQRIPPADSSPGRSVVPEDVAEMLRQLERLQRAAEHEASKLERDTRAQDERDRPTPGGPQIGQAAEQMRQAADRLGEHDPVAARTSQQNALAQLQQALDELDDALRQVRREEREETLAALETRFGSMLTREREVREAVVTLDEKGAESWTRLDRLRLAESVETQRGVCEDCDTTLRILVDEGSTVIVPELVRQVAGDMRDVYSRLERSETSAETQGVLADIIALLEDILAAIERKREQDAGLAEDRQPPGRRSPALLPGSAELKLLRSAQMRLNQRTVELADAAQASEADRAQGLERLSQRQRRLADLARRMNERN